MACRRRWSMTALLSQCYALLSNSMLPKSGQLRLLYKAVPILERKELPPLFSVEDTSKLLAHLQVPSPM